MNWSVSQDLEAAADLLEKNGWIQGAWERNGMYCSDGAIQQVIQNDAYAGSSTRYKRVVAAFRRYALNKRGASIPHWNDNVAKDAQEVIDKFRYAAKMARIEEESRER